MMDWGIRRSIMFHVRRRPADSQPRRRKKKPLGAANGANNTSNDREGPVLVEVTHSGDGGRRIKLGNDPVEVGSANTNTLQLFGPSIQARHCLISLSEGVCTVTPLHADALTFVNGHHIVQPTILHNGSVVMFGRVASFRFLDSPSDGRYNLALSQSQLDSACLYESRSPTSPASWNEDDGTLNLNQKGDSEATSNHYHINSGITLDLMLNLTEDTKAMPSKLKHEILLSYGRETELNSDGIEAILESETKSISSVKSDGSTTQEQRSQKIVSGVENQGQEPILPAVLEFPETYQDNFLSQILSELDVNAPHFKLAPVYTLYLCARYRASTHYRPELQPTERAHKLTIFLHHVANLMYSIIQQQYTDPRVLAFWMANSSEFLHFLKSDRHISAFSVQAQEILAETVQNAFRNLVNCYRVELSQTLNQFLSETIDHDSAAGLVLTVLGSVMALLRRCRVNAALTIQLFSQLFHYINVICFNTIVANSHMCTSEWGKILMERLQLLELWAERQGLELAADCHLAKINQCAQFLQAPKTSVEEIQKLACSCFRLNSLQMSALLQREKIPRALIDTVIRMAESVADELTRADGRDVRLEEIPELHLALLLPDDGFSCDVVRGIPSGLVDFLNPLQSAGMCRLAAQPTSIGLWTVYMHQFNMRPSSSTSNKLPLPEVQVIKLQKNSNGMGLSIVAAKGAGQERLGIYIKSVVPGGAADSDSRLQAGDQLLRVDGQSLIGITQERAADYLVRTGPIVTLEVAKQGAIYHGLATLLQQPSPISQRGTRRLSERDISKLGDELKSVGSLTSSSHLSNSRSTPALHHSSNNTLTNPKSRSTCNLANNNNEQGFYQNLSVYRAQNQNQSVIGERSQLDLSYSAVNGNSENLINSVQQSTSSNSISGVLHPKPVISPTSINENNILNRPVSAYYQTSVSQNYPTNTSNTLMPLSNSMLASIGNHGINDNMININTNGNKLTLPNSQLLHTQPHSSLRPYSTHNFNRDPQSQAHLQFNQLLAPSMPNIAAIQATNVYNSGISASQSMQNVTMLPNSANSVETFQQHGYKSGQYNNNEQYLTKTSLSSGGHDQINIENASIKRNNPLDIMQEPLLQVAGMTLSSSNHQLQQQEQHLVNSVKLQQKYSSDKQPIVSSKPQVMPSNPKYQSVRISQSYKQTQGSEDTPPLPPSATHPLYKAITQTPVGINYVASTLEPQKGSFYSINTNNNAHQASFVGANPWEREEREKEHEIRREHIRHWRDEQISELSGLTKRSAHQEEQLKTLVLEKEFERRAQEVKEQEDESDPCFEKGSYQETARHMNQGSVLQTPTTNFRQTDKGINQEDNIGLPATISKSDSKPLAKSHQIYQSHTPLAVQPKSILKNNRYDTSFSPITPSSPSKSHKSASFADDKHLQMEHSMSTLTKSVANINLGIGNDANISEHFVSTEPILLPSNNTMPSIIPPPPPPERNSSYVVMSQQQQKIFCSNTNFLKSTPLSEIPDLENISTYSNGCTNNKKSGFAVGSNINNNILKHIQTHGSNEAHSTNLSISGNLLILGRDNKRVSFHDEENNHIPSEIMSLKNEQTLTNDNPEFITTNERLHELKSEYEYKDMAQKPTTPDADVWNSTLQSTPGVIGAQEVYRDPRQRRLAEQQQRQQQRTSDAVPEKLSFKEKMKMFALESGEDETPKDKLKISRAQRNIDAVH